MRPLELFQPNAIVDRQPFLSHRRPFARAALRMLFPSP